LVAEMGLKVTLQGILAVGFLAVFGARNGGAGVIASVLPSTWDLYGLREAG
jgi:hypothetical protein